LSNLARHPKTKGQEIKKQNTKKKKKGALIFELVKTIVNTLTKKPISDFDIENHHHHQ
jgi:hypothetical protein